MSTLFEEQTLLSVQRIITHADCPDGYASAMLLVNVLPEATIEFVQYDTPEYERLEATEHMLFCDITPPRERVQEFVDVQAIVLDHHDGAEDLVTAFGDRGVYGNKATDPDLSGAGLAFHHVWLPLNANPGMVRTVSEFAELAAVRDNWQTKDERWWKACCQASALMFFGTDQLLDGRVPYLSQNEMRIGEILMARRTDRAIEQARRLFGVRGFYFFNDSGAEKLISDVAEQFRKLGAPAGAKAVIGYRTENELDGRELSYHYSLRSVDDTDVAEIAKMFGGNGHTHSAGCRIVINSTMGSAISAFLCGLGGGRF